MRKVSTLENLSFTPITWFQVPCDTRLYATTFETFSMNISFHELSKKMREGTTWLESPAPNGNFHAHPIAFAQESNGITRMVILSVPNICPFCFDEYAKSPTLAEYLSQPAMYEIQPR